MRILASPLLAVIAFVMAPGAPGPARALAQSTVAFTHVSVIDGRDSLLRRDQTVVIRGNRIIAAAAAGATPVPAGARVVDGRGKFLIPGLWDMHVHTAIIGGRELLGFYVANGVTGIRDMAGDWAVLTAWRKEISRGTLVGPVLGAAAVNLGKSWFTKAFPEYWLFALGLLFVLVTLFLPRGLAGLRLWRRRAS